MASQAASAPSSARWIEGEPVTAPQRAGVQTSGTSGWGGEMRYVARQPILNLRGHVHGYELLFRDPLETTQTTAPPAADLATRTMLDNAVIFGLDWLTNGMPAFVSCTAESLTEDLVLVLAPRDTVLNLPANLELTPRLLDACKKLKTRGFRLALDDFTWDPALRPLADLCDYIRVDFARFGAAEREYLQGLDNASLLMVAKNVNTQDDYQYAAAQGFTLFQGEFFCHPVLLKKRKVPANRQLHFEIVRMLHHDPMELHQVSRLVMQDAALTYRLLRLVNSPLYGMYHEVRSVETAILAMGETTFRRVVSLAVLSEMSTDTPPEILHMALVRARFCEMAAPLCGLDPAEQYLLGMLSLVPAMLRLPMEELTPSLPLRTEICAALQGTLNAERGLLTWLESHERGNWETCDVMMQANQLNSAQVLRCYAESAKWAATALQTTA